MIAALARASIEGALLVVVVWLLARVLRVSPATRTVLWWCAAAKFVLALIRTAPIEIPVLPSRSAAAVATEHRVTTQVISDNQAAANASRPDPPAASRGTLARFADGLREWWSFAAAADGGGPSAATD
jgi:hypothetical protein